LLSFLKEQKQSIKKSKQKSIKTTHKSRKVSASTNARHKHQKVQEFLRCYPTSTQKRRLFQSHIFSNATNHQLYEWNECDEVEYGGHSYNREKSCLIIGELREFFWKHS
jgi:hypothetical protein